MRDFLPTALLTAGLACAPLAAQDFQPETVTRIENISAGPHLFVHGQNKIHVIDAQAFKYQGSISVGANTGGQKDVFSADGKTVYLAKINFAQGLSSKRADVVERWDVATLSPIDETALPITKLAMRGSDLALAALSSDQRWIYLQNATPATSVSTYDISRNAFGAEIPLPGCWGVYPVPKASRFVSLCGDGRLATVSVSTAGASTGVERSEKIFDVDQDPLFTAYQRLGDELLMVSFNGNLYRIDISGKTARLRAKVALATGIDGGWRPSGMQLLALAPEAKILYVLMRKNAKDGDHVEPANEVWAYDLGRNRLLSRSTAEGAVALAYHGGSTPQLYVGVREVGVARYALDPGAAWTARLDRTMKLDGSNALEVR